MINSELSSEGKVIARLNRMRKVRFANGEFFHVYNRGVEKRRIFQCEAEHRRFLDSLREFNNLNHRADYSTLTHPPLRKVISLPVVPLVKIHSFCLMPNHFHLLLEQLYKDGVRGFMHRVGTGYTNYFNLRNERTGRLFESSYKAIHVDSTEYLTHLSRYIHLNPLELEYKDWKIAGCPRDRAKAFIRNYAWSNYLNHTDDYERYDVSPIISSLFTSGKEYENFLLDWSQNNNHYFQTVEHKLGA